MAIIGMRDMCWGFGGAPLPENITLQIEKGEHLCLVGRNGVGKYTLLRILLKEMSPEAGSVRHGTHLQAAYFCHLRARLDEQKT